MLPFLFTVTAPKRPPIAEVQAIVGAALKRFGYGIKWAAGECGYAARQHFERSLESGGCIARLALLPDEIKRAIYRDLGPLFGVSAAAADNPELEKRIADLEAERDREAREREADRQRLNELEAIVRRLSQPASPQQPHEERQIA
jgi:hypothetical protein